MLVKFKRRWIRVFFIKGAFQRSLVMNITLLILLVFIYCCMPFRFTALWPEFVPAKEIALDLHREYPLPLMRIYKMCPILEPSNEDRAFNKDQLLSIYKKKTSKESLGKLAEHLHLKIGGEWLPQNCIPQFKVAIIVPFRDRDLHLTNFLSYIHPFLQKQKIHYRIFVVEQSHLFKFNRGIIFNAGFKEVLKLWDCDCFIFHDVDLLPEKLENIYACSKSPRHASPAVNTLRYNLPDTNMFGGVTAIRKFQFIEINGYSNLYYGWGAEDDDIYQRLMNKGYKVIRWHPSVARYTMMFHTKSKSNPSRFDLLGSAKERNDRDGLSSLSYRLIRIENRQMYTHIYIDIVV